MWFGGRGGGVPLETGIGAATLVWMSMNDRGIDWSRMGHVVDDLRLSPAAPALESALQSCLTQLARPRIPSCVVRRHPSCAARPLNIPHDAAENGGETTTDCEPHDVGDAHESLSREV